MSSATTTTTTTTQHTLYLWHEGMYPRRVVYFLLSKGLVSSPSDLLAGKPATSLLENSGGSSSTLSIVRMRPNLTRDPADPAQAFWLFDPPSSALAPGVSTPCLRVVVGGQTTWIHESHSILTYLDSFYASPTFPALSPSPTSSLLLATLTADRLDGIIAAFAHTGTYLRHSSPQLAAFAAMAPGGSSERSELAGRQGKNSARAQLGRVVGWLLESEGEGWSGFLTPGIKGPGVVDFSLASGRRYIEIAYGWDLFAEEEGDAENGTGGGLRELREWYARFQRAVGWWEELEGNGADKAGLLVHAPELKFDREF